MKTLVRTVASGLLLSLSALNAQAETAYLLAGNHLLHRFVTDTPGAFDASIPLSGLGAGETAIGMDARPLTRQLYVLTQDAANAGRIYTLNSDTGAATLVATLAADPADLTDPYTALGGTSFGVDFNPVPDRLRVESNALQNLRVNPATGLVTTDNALNPGTPQIVGSGYTNSYAGAPSTTLYTLDANADVLAIQNPPNNGTLVMVGALGFDFSQLAGFDIAGGSGVQTAYAALTVGGLSGFYRIDLTTGGATLFGQLPGSPPIIDMAVSLDIVFYNGFE